MQRDAACGSSEKALQSSDSASRRGRLITGGSRTRRLPERPILKLRQKNTANGRTAQRRCSEMGRLSRSRMHWVAAVVAQSGSRARPVQDPNSQPISDRAIGSSPSAGAGRRPSPRSCLCRPDAAQSRGADGRARIDDSATGVRPESSDPLAGNLGSSPWLPHAPPGALPASSYESAVRSLSATRGSRGPPGESLRWSDACIATISVVSRVWSTQC